MRRWRRLSIPVEASPVNGKGREFALWFQQVHDQKTRVVGSTGQVGEIGTAVQRSVSLSAQRLRKIQNRFLGVGLPCYYEVVNAHRCDDVGVIVEVLCAVFERVTSAGDQGADFLAEWIFVDAVECYQVISKIFLMLFFKRRSLI